MNETSCRGSALRQLRRRLQRAQHACSDEASRQPVALSLCHGVLSLAQSHEVLAAGCSPQGRGAQLGLSARSSEAWQVRLWARGWGARFFSQLLSSQGISLMFLCLFFPESQRPYITQDGGLDGTHLDLIKSRSSVTVSTLRC